MDLNTLPEDFNMLFHRGLDQLITNIEDTPEVLLWQTPDGISNSCGVLIQHLVGNLNHYIGKGIGETGYIRKRDQEFATTDTSKQELIEQVENLQSTLQTVFTNLTEDDLQKEYPLDFPFEGSNQGALLHLYGHLNYHMGQYNYLRRIQSS